MKTKIWFSPQGFKSKRLLRADVETTSQKWTVGNQHIGVVKRKSGWKVRLQDQTTMDRVWTRGDVLIKKNQTLVPLVSYHRIVRVGILVICVMFSLRFALTSMNQTMAQPDVSVPEIETVDLTQETPLKPLETGHDMEAIAFEEMTLDDSDQVTYVEPPSELPISWETVKAKVKTHTIHRPQKVIPSKKTAPQSSSVYLKAKKDFLHGRIQPAKKALESLDRLSLEERKLLSEMYVLTCKQWVVKKDIQKAIIDCERAKALFPHEVARTFLKETESQAKDLYYQAYALESIDPQEALTLYQQAILYAPSQSAWKKKSLRKVVRLQEQT